MAKLAYQNLETPEPTVMKFGMGDCVSDVIRKQKFKPIAPMGASWKIG